MIEISHRKPDSRLSKYIRKITVFESKRKINYKQKLTPSAFTYFSYNHKSIPTSIFGNKRVKPDQRLQIAGPKINEDIYVEYDGRLNQILFEFTPSGFYYLFNVSPAKLINSLSNLSDYVSCETYEQLKQDLLASDDIEQQIKMLEEVLFEKEQVSLPFSNYVEKALKIIEENNGSVHISDVIDEVGISERQLNRKFREVVGTSPKNYAKITQLHYVINLMQLKNFTSAQDLAYQAEYYDLPHFANRFKELTGFTPNEFIVSDKHIARKYFTDLIK